LPYCKAIRSAVEGETPSEKAPALAKSDDSGTKITLIFGGITISAVEMETLLLAAESFLPSTIGTLEIRDLSIEGRLELHHVEFRRTLVFRDLVFVSDSGDCGTSQSGGISIDSSVFWATVILKRVRGCGDISIITSHFRRGLQYNNAGPSDESAVDGELLAAKSRIDGEFFIYNLSINKLGVHYSVLDDIVVSGLTATEQFSVRDSESWGLSPWAPA
jgi:hypothetical protein